jgi:ribosomal protein L29
MEAIKMKKDEKNLKKMSLEEREPKLRELSDEELDNISAGKMSPYVKDKLVKTVIKH